MAVCQNLVPLVNIKIAGKWMFIPLKMILIGIDPYPYGSHKPITGQCDKKIQKTPASSLADNHGPQICSAPFCKI